MIREFVRMEVVEVDGKCIVKILATPIPSEPAQAARRPNREPKSTLSLVNAWLVCRLFAISTQMTAFRQPVLRLHCSPQTKIFNALLYIDFSHYAAADRDGTGDASNQAPPSHQ